MEKKRFYIRHISKGILVNTQSGEPAYLPNPPFYLRWLGTHSQAEKKLNDLGHQLHDMGEILC